MADRRQHPGRRAGDKVKRRIEQLRAVWRDLVPAIAIGLATWSVIVQQGTVNDLKAEAALRTDGQCTIFEGQHADDVQSLTSTYSYLLTVEPEDRDDAIFQFVVRNLPVTEARAYKDRAPDYCDLETDDGGDVGLPEPDPEVPDRPAGLTKALRLPAQPPR